MSDARGDALDAYQRMLGRARSVCDRLAADDLGDEEAHDLLHWLNVADDALRTALEPPPADMPALLAADFDRELAGLPPA